MPTYLLPCACGRKVPVTTSQAGLSATCECGAALEVPTRRGLAALEEVTEPQPGAGQAVRRPGRGVGQKGLFLGLAMLAVGLAGGVFCTFYQPRDPVVEGIRAASLAETTLYWSHLNERSNIMVSVKDDPRRDDDNADLKRKIMRQRLWGKMAYGVAAAGLLTAIGSLALARQKAPRR